jgi:hypothetical protein
MAVKDELFELIAGVTDAQARPVMTFARALLRHDARAVDLQELDDLLAQTKADIEWQNSQAAMAALPEDDEPETEAEGAAVAEALGSHEPRISSEEAKQRWR